MKLTYSRSLGFPILVLALFGAMAALDAKADTVAFTSPGGLTTDWGADNPVNIGLVFTVNSTFSVDALGIYDQSFLTGPEQVGLYNSSGTLLASATVTLSDPLVSGYLFQSITPITLNAGSTYTVDAYVGNNPWALGPAPTTASNITLDNTEYLYGNSLEFPTNGPGVAGYYGPNFEIQTNSDPVVPEPRGIGILMTLAALAGCLYWRKDRSLPTESSLQ